MHCIVFAVFWGLSVLGATLIVTKGRIFAPVRRLARRRNANGLGAETELSRFLGCPLCMGFWVGVMFFAMGFGVVTFHDHSGLIGLVAVGLVHGAAAACVARLGAELSEILQQLSYAMSQWTWAQATRAQAPSPGEFPPSNTHQSEEETPAP